MRWKDFLDATPDVAVPGADRFRKDGFGFLGTIRKDGTPRISPVDTTFAGGELVLGMPHGSQKAVDLSRDPRCVLHSAVMNSDNSNGDFKVSGVANEILDESLFEILADMAESEYGSRPSFGAAYYVTIDVRSASIVNAPKRSVTIWNESTGKTSKKKTAGIND